MSSLLAWALLAKFCGEVKLKDPEVGSWLTSPEMEGQLCEVEACSPGPAHVSQLDSCLSERNHVGFVDVGR